MARPNIKRAGSEFATQEQNAASLAAMQERQAQAAEQETINILPSEELGKQLIQELPESLGVPRVDTSRGVPVTRGVPVSEETRALDEETERFKQRKPIGEVLESSQNPLQTPYEEISANVNARLLEQSEARKANPNLVDLKKDNLEATFENEKRKEKTSATEIGAFFDAYSMINESILDPTDIVFSDDVNGDVSFGDLVKSSFEGSFNSSELAMALQISTFNEVNEIQRMRLNNQELSINENDFSRDEFDSGNTNEFLTFDEMQGTLVGESVGALKGKIVNDPAKINDYQFLHNTARRIGESAGKILGAKADPDSATILGEKVLQKYIDEGLVGIYSFTDSRGETPLTRYYPQVLNQGDALANTANTLSQVLNPGSELTDTSSYTPPVSILPRNLKGEFINREGRIKTKDGTYSATEATLALNASVGREVDEGVLNIVTELFGRDDYKYYFKSSEKDTETTRREIELKHTAKLRQAAIRLGQDPDAFVASRAEEIKSKGESAVQTSLKNSEQKNKNDLFLLNRRLTDVDENGKQRIRFISWMASTVNNRIQEKSRDGQSDSKAIIRAADNFAEKAYVPVKSISKLINASKFYAKTLRGITMSAEDRSKDGIEALKKFNKLPTIEQDEMNMIVMWVGTYIKLGKGGSLPLYKYTKGAIPLKPTTTRMSPAMMIEYFSLNGEVIMNTLRGYSYEVSTWEANPSTIPPRNALNSWQEEVLSRGDLGYHITNLRDINNYVNSPEGTPLKLTGMYEIDANNSNVAIQSIKTGNIENARVLGFFTSNGDSIDNWYDVKNNPDSFYNILSDSIVEVTRNSFSNKDKADALISFVKEIIDSGNGKDLNRPSVIEGFYGLHPRINISAARELLINFEEIADNTLFKEGSPYADMKGTFNEILVNDVLFMLGQNYNQRLGQISISPTLKKIGAIISLNGDYAPHIITDMGDIIKSQVGELMPDYLQEEGMEYATEGMFKPKMDTYIDPQNGEQPYLSTKRVIDDMKHRYTVDAQGDVKDISKTYGARLMDGLPAIFTHTQDAALEKLSIMTQNVYRTSNLAAPNISIHDANKLNAKSLIQHSIAYNQVAIPSLAMQEDSYLKIVDIANEVVKLLEAEARKAKAEGRNIPVGSQNSNHRSLFTILDKEYESNKTPIDKQVEIDLGKDRYNRDVKRRALSLKVLENAAKFGWVPLDPAHPQYQKMRDEGVSPIEYRKFAQVTPNDFMGLVDTVQYLKGFKLMPGESGKQTRIQATINKWANHAKLLTRFILKGKFVNTGQN